MTVRICAKPSFSIQCQHGETGTECLAVLVIRDCWSSREARSRARAEHHWQVRPAHGKGQRTAPDLCPVHKKEV